MQTVELLRRKTRGADCEAAVLGVDWRGRRYGALRVGRRKTSHFLGCRSWFCLPKVALQWQLLPVLAAVNKRRRIREPILWTIFMGEPRSLFAFGDVSGVGVRKSSHRKIEIERLLRYALRNNRDLRCFLHLTQQPLGHIERCKAPHTMAGGIGNVEWVSVFDTDHNAGRKRTPIGILRDPVSFPVRSRPIERTLIVFLSF